MMGRYPIVFRIWKVGTDQSGGCKMFDRSKVTFPFNSGKMYKYNPIKTRIFSKSVEESLRKETSH